MKERDLCNTSEEESLCWREVGTRSRHWPCSLPLPPNHFARNTFCATWTSSSSTIELINVNLKGNLIIGEFRRSIKKDLHMSNKEVANHHHKQRNTQRRSLSHPYTTTHSHEMISASKSEVLHSETCSISLRQTYERTPTLFSCSTPACRTTGYIQARRSSQRAKQVPSKTYIQRPTNNVHQRSRVTDSECRAMYSVCWNSGYSRIASSIRVATYFSLR